MKTGDKTNEFKIIQSYKYTICITNHLCMWVSLRMKLHNMIDFCLLMETFRQISTNWGGPCSPSSWCCLDRSLPSPQTLSWSPLGLAMPTSLSCLRSWLWPPDNPETAMVCWGAARLSKGMRRTITMRFDEICGLNGSRGSQNKARLWKNIPEYRSILTTWDYLSYPTV